MAGAVQRKPVHTDLLISIILAAFPMATKWIIYAGTGCAAIRRTWKQSRCKKIDAGGMPIRHTASAAMSLTTRILYEVVIADIAGYVTRSEAESLWSNTLGIMLRNAESIRLELRSHNDNSGRVLWLVIGRAQCIDLYVFPPGESSGDYLEVG